MTLLGGEAEILQRLTRLDQLCAILILGVHCDSDHYGLRSSGFATLSHPAKRRRSLCGHDCRVTNDMGVMVSAERAELSGRLSVVRAAELVP
jgi:hypothetical protein